MLGQHAIPNRASVGNQGLEPATFIAEVNRSRMCRSGVVRLIHPPT